MAPHVSPYAQPACEDISGSSLRHAYKLWCCDHTPRTGGWVRCWAGAALAGHLRQGVQACAACASSRRAAPERGAQARPRGLAQRIGHRSAAGGAGQRRRPPRPARQLLQQPLRAPARGCMQSAMVACRMRV